MSRIHSGGFNSLRDFSRQATASDWGYAYARTTWEILALAGLSENGRIGW
jgi:hypothetical protein